MRSWTGQTWMPSSNANWWNWKALTRAIDGLASPPEAVLSLAPFRASAN